MQSWLISFFTPATIKILQMQNTWIQTSLGLCQHKDMRGIEEALCHISAAFGRVKVRGSEVNLLNLASGLFLSSWSFPQKMENLISIFWENLCRGMRNQWPCLGQQPPLTLFGYGGSLLWVDCAAGLCVLARRQSRQGSEPPFWPHQ